MLATGLACLACQGAESIQLGMSREEVVAQRGAPDLLITDANKMEIYLSGAPCSVPHQPATLVVYIRWLISDVAVSYNSADQVLCAWAVNVDVIVTIH